MMLPNCTYICMCENGNEERDTARDLPVSTPKEEEEEEEKTCVCACVGVPLPQLLSSSFLSFRTV